MSRDREVIDKKYVLDRLIGMGGVAFVYKAWDIMLHKYVAAKKIHEEYAQDANFVDMFRQEAVNTARLEHENIVRVVNFIKDQGNYYIIMDYVNGVDLDYMLGKCNERKISIPSDIAVYIMSEVTKALDYAHNVKDEASGEPLNIVHRDLSPGNIMLHYDGRVKLSDFGIAKAGTTEEDDEKIMGKVSYMSPEQAKCQGVDSRSDLFGCGLVLYEMLTGEKPYQGKSDMGIWKKAKKGEINFKKLNKKGIDENLIDVIKRLLQKEPEQRYQNAAELFIDLKKILSKSGRTSEIEKKYSNFIGSVLREELEASEKETQKDLEKKYEIDVESEEWDKKKARGEAAAADDAHGKVNLTKQLLKVLAASILLGMVAFIYVDLQKHDSHIKRLITTVMTSEEFDLKIDTVPSGAAIEILDDSGSNILEKRGIEGRTPLYVSEIGSGNYTIRAEKENFGIMSRRMTVMDNEAFISEAEKDEDNIYVLPFDVKVEVDSQPGGADVYINNRRVGRTPYEGVLEVGKYNFQLEKPGYETLGVRDPGLGRIGDLKSVCALDLSIPVDQQTGIDYRFWEVDKVEDNSRQRLRIYGFLREN